MYVAIALRGWDVSVVELEVAVNGAEKGSE
jgi:hypothetical protein